LNCCGPPEAEGIEHVPPAFGEDDVEPAAHRPRALTPDQKDLRRVIENRALKVGHTSPIFIVRRSMPNPIQRGVDGWAAGRLQVERYSRVEMPE
jgi:hypothetical protein